MVGADNEDIPLISDAYNATIANTGDLNIKTVSQMNVLLVMKMLYKLESVHVLIIKNNNYRLEVIKLLITIVIFYVSIFYYFLLRLMPK